MYMNKSYEETTMTNDGEVNYNTGACCNPCPDMCVPVMECPQERVCHQQICHDVKHIVPINTRIINHHIYRHYYEPVYTCCMQDEICNVYDNKCNF